MEVGSTAAPGSPPPPMPAASGTTEPLATRLPAGSYRFTAGQAGVVTIRLSGGGVALESMEPNDGWSHRPDGSDAEGGEIELRFVGPDSAGLDLAAERDDDGTLDTRIAESTVAGDRQRTATSGDAGAVTFTIVGEQLRVDDARAENQAGWHIVEDEFDEESFSIAFANASRSTSIRMSADLGDDQRLEMETHTRIGPGYRAELRDEEPDPTPTITPRPTARPTPTDDDDDDRDDDDDDDDDDDEPESRDSVVSRDSGGSAASGDGVGAVRA
ncbi:MAG: hypothetical protein WKF46_05865, partial [Candidatus Limnocylindrales bacterium]